MTPTMQQIEVNVDSELEPTAWHEAGHAVHRVIARLPFRYVTIRPRQAGVLGRLVVRRRRTDPVLDAVNAAAGPVAEMMLYRSLGHDADDARWLVDFCGGDARDREVAARLGFDWPDLCTVAETVLSRRRGAVEAVACALLVHKTLDQSAVRALVVDSPGGL